MRPLFLLPVSGLAAIVFGAVWMTAIFPNYEKMPSDFSSVTEFEGTYTVVDPIVQQAQANATIQELRGSPTTLALLADPQVLQLLAGPELSVLLADPAIVQQFLINPGAVLQQASPEVLSVLADPRVQALLADPGVQRLLADPAALRLVTDPRTLQLLADPTALPVVQVTVLVHRERTATDSDARSIVLNEQVATARADTGEELVGFPPTDVELVVDRSTKLYVEGGDAARAGGLGFPFNVKENEVYPLWVGAAGQPLDAAYVSTEKLDGLSVMRFKIDEKDLPLGVHPTLGLPLVLDSDISVTVEPRSGRVVDVVDHATVVSLVHPQRGKQPVFVSDIEFTQETVDRKLEAAKSDRNRLVRFGSTVPWTLMGLGIFLALFGAFLIALPRLRKAAQ